MEKELDAIAASAPELEIELARLQHDSTSDMRIAEETMTETTELGKLLSEMEFNVELLER
ncbi:hypothetical protein Ahy_A08g039256 [Arachis hypogaea]|uniref:Uncharacterized protein n=1 Tax=Arachis hypogaea TaxID=3818 RepID=A0A445BVR5_ARAHY|nr:hypothetical protein Ahy_A08g039256 [Arachis hypogaea]